MGILMRRRRWRTQWLCRRFDDCGKSDHGIALDVSQGSVVFGVRNRVFI
jgi:hypothetical protein